MPDYDHALAWSEHNRWWYRASAFGGCMKALAAAREGVTGAAPPLAMQLRFDEGKRLERVVIERFCREGGWDYAESLDTWEMELGREWGVAGHIDGLIWQNPQQDFVIEVKCLGDDLASQFIKRVGVWPQGKLWDKYAWQTSAYIHATGRELFFVVGHKMVVDDEVRIGDVSHIRMRTPLKSRAQFLMRAREIDRTVAGECDAGDYPCPYYFLHAVKEDIVPGQVVVNIDSDDLARALSDHAEAQTASKLAVDNTKRTRKALDKMLEKMDLQRAGQVVRCGEWQVEWVERERSESVTRAFTMRFPEVKRNPVLMPDDPFEGVNR